jgi:hypothetical protein
MANTITAVTPRNPNTIIGRMTRYAIECVIDGQSNVIGYTARPSKHSLLAAARTQAEAILPFLAEDDRCSYRAGVLTLGSRVTLRIGQTERETAKLY